MDQGCQQPVDEHQLVLRTSTYGLLPLAGGKSGLVSLTPQRADLSDEFSDHIGRQARGAAGC
jgi:hypothetical protein